MASRNRLRRLTLCVSPDLGNETPRVRHGPAKRLRPLDPVTAGTGWVYSVAWGDVSAQQLRGEFCLATPPARTTGPSLDGPRRLSGDGCGTYYSPSTRTMHLDSGQIINGQRLRRQCARADRTIVPRQGHLVISAQAVVNAGALHFASPRRPLMPVGRGSWRVWRRRGRSPVDDLPPAHGYVEATVSIGARPGAVG